MKKKIIYVGLITLTFISIILLDTLAFDNVFDENAKTNDITELLSKKLHYKEINATSVNGFIVSEGIYGDSHLITINKSALKSITIKEAIKIQELFNKELNHFKEADFIELTFNSINSENKKIVFKRGEITNL